MRGRAVGRIEWPALPVGHRHPVIQAFPPRLVVGGQGDVGEDGVALDGRQRVGVGFGRSPRGHAEEAGLRIDRPQPPVRARAHPADVIAHRPHLPAGLAVALRRDQHGQVGLAAGAGEGRGEVTGLALRVLHPQDQHVLGQPAFLARLPGGDAQGVALLAQQRVAAIARTVGLDLQRLGEMHDEAALRVQFADRMQALDEAAGRLAARGGLGAFALDPRQCGRAHAGHDPHVGHHVGRIGDLHPAAGQRRVDRAHAVGDHVQGAPAHAAVEQRVDLRVGLVRRHPVVVGAGVLALAGADEGQVLDPGHVVRMRTMQVAAGVGVRVERQQGAVGQHARDQGLVFAVAAVAPVDRVGPGQGSDLGHPAVQRRQGAAVGRRGVLARDSIHG